MKQTSLSETLLRLRREKGVSREQAANEIGITYAALMSYELGERVPGDSRKRLIADYYRKDLAELFFPVKTNAKE